MAPRIGDLIRVENKNQKSSANRSYLAIRLQLEDGTETWAFFTDSQIKDGIERARKNNEDIPEMKGIFGKLQDMMD